MKRVPSFYYSMDLFPSEVWTHTFWHLEAPELRAVADTSRELRRIVDRMHDEAHPERYIWLVSNGLLRRRHIRHPILVKRLRRSRALRKLAIRSGHPETVLIATGGSRISWMLKGDFWELTCDVVPPPCWADREYLRVYTGLPESPRDRVMRLLAEAGLRNPGSVWNNEYNRRVMCNFQCRLNPKQACRWDLLTIVSLNTLYDIWRVSPQAAEQLILQDVLRGTIMHGYYPRHEPEVRRFIKWLVEHDNGRWRQRIRLIRLMYLTDQKAFTVDDIEFMKMNFERVSSGDTWDYPPEVVPRPAEQIFIKLNPIRRDTTIRALELGWQIHLNARIRHGLLEEPVYTYSLTVYKCLLNLSELHRVGLLSSPDIPEGVQIIIKNGSWFSNVDLIRGPVAARLFLPHVRLSNPHSMIPVRVLQNPDPHVREWWHSIRHRIPEHLTPAGRENLVMEGYIHFERIRLLK
jgi:hypothetical protein